MTPGVWIALAYGAVALVLVVYTVRLRRLVRGMETSEHPR